MFSALSVVNTLSVSIQSSGKRRLILDLRYPNCFLKKCKVNFEDAKNMMSSLIEYPQSSLFSFEIKSVTLIFFPEDKQFLGFFWVCAGLIKYFKFTVLPFGLATGPYIFTIGEAMA